MKKLLGFIALVALLVIPFKVSAAQYEVSYTNNGDIDTEGNFTVTVKVRQSGNSSVTDFSTTMSLTNVTFIPEGTVTNKGWTVTQDPANPNKLNFSSGVALTDSSFTVATLKFKKIDTAAECNVLFECEGTTKTVTPDKTPTENPTTGAVLPYAVIAVGVVMAGAVYYVTRRNTKLYRI